MRIEGKLVIDFRRDKPFKKVESAVKKALTAQGAFIRTYAKRSLRPARKQALSEMPPRLRALYQMAVKRRKKLGLPPPKFLAPSKPGEPPRLHRKDSLLKKFLVFGYDPTTKTVVVGPKVSKKNKGIGVLEYGGTDTLMYFDPRQKRMIKTNAQIAARPFMAPAFQRSVDKLPNLWTDILHE